MLKIRSFLLERLIYKGLFIKYKCRKATRASAVNWGPVTSALLPSFKGWGRGQSTEPKSKECHELPTGWRGSVIFGQGTQPTNYDLARRDPGTKIHWTYYSPFLWCPTRATHWPEAMGTITIHSGQPPGIECKMEKGEKKWEVDLEEQTMIPKIKSLLFGSHYMLIHYV